MKDTGIVRKVDNLGRIVLPKELRSNMRIADNDPVEIFVDGENIIMRKQEYHCVFCKSSDDPLLFHGKIICAPCRKALMRAMFP